MKGDRHHPTSSNRRRNRAARTERLEVRLSQEEYDALAERAMKVGLSLAAYMAAAALDKPLTVSERRVLGSEVVQAERMLRGVSTNLNQLAEIANATGRVPEGTEQALAEVSQVCQRIVAMSTASGWRLEDPE